MPHLCCKDYIPDMLWKWLTGKQFSTVSFCNIQQICAWAPGPRSQRIFSSLSFSSSDGKFIYFRLWRFNVTPKGNVVSAANSIFPQSYKSSSPVFHIVDELTWYLSLLLTSKKWFCLFCTCLLLQIYYDFNLHICMNSGPRPLLFVQKR